MSHVPMISGDNFEREVLESEVPVLIDFYADWCGPCRSMTPIVDRLATELGQKAKVVKIDTDAQPELASAFRISSIPAFYVMHHGQVVDGSIGVTPAERLREMVERASDGIVEANE
jgi:thioredoxin 1